MIDLIAENLRDNFDKDINIFVDEVDEGLIGPCFFIRLVNSELKREFQGLLVFDELYSVSYLTDSDHVSNDVIYKILRCLESVGGVRAYGVSYDLVKDEVGSTAVFSASYSRYFREDEADDYMLYLKQRALSRL